MTTVPKWMLKHPCTECGTGYGMCAQGLLVNLMCCKGCSHPDRWKPDAYTKEDYIEMWDGKEMPESTKRHLEKM